MALSMRRHRQILPSIIGVAILVNSLANFGNWPQRSKGNASFFVFYRRKKPAFPYENREKRVLYYFAFFVLSARSRNRTGTPLQAGDFKSPVSTSFTIRAARRDSSTGDAHHAILCLSQAVRFAPDSLVLSTRHQNVALNCTPYVRGSLTMPVRLLNSMAPRAWTWLVMLRPYAESS